MKRRAPALAHAVGVQFEPSGVSLAVRRDRRIGVPVRRTLAHAGDCREALAALVAQEQVAGARCVASLPARRCRVEWASFSGARLRDLRAAVGRPAFWQARLGVVFESHRVWWRFARRGGRRIDALLAAAPREDVAHYTDTIRAAGLTVGAIGIACFDYFDATPAPDTPRAALILDSDDACVVAAGAFGVRVHAVTFDGRSATALATADVQACDGVVNRLAAGVQRCVEDEQSATRVHAEVQVIAARGMHGDWLALLQARLPGFHLELTSGWEAAGLAAPDADAGESLRLPGAAACLAHDTRRGGNRLRRVLVPAAKAVNFAGDGSAARRWHRLAPALLVAAGLLSTFSIGAHWLLLAEHRRLQPDADRHVQLTEIRDRIRAEITALQNRLLHRVSFYSGIQRVSFERKLMPRLLALIEYATFEGVWLDTMHFRQPASLRITGKSLSNEQLARFIQRLRAADEIADVFLESATTAEHRDAAPTPAQPRLQAFAITCRLQTPGEKP